MTEILTPVRTPTLKLQLPLLSKLELTSRCIRNFLERFTQNTKRKKKVWNPQKVNLLWPFYTFCWNFTQNVLSQEPSHGTLYSTQGVELTKTNY